MAKPITVRIKGDSSGFERALGKVEGKLGKFGKVAKGAMLGAGAVAGAALVSSVTKAIDGEMTSDRIAASMGMDPETQAKLGKVAGEVYVAGWGDSMAQVTEVAAVVSKTLGDNLSTDAIQDLSEDALAFSEIFNVDVNKAISNAGILMKTGLAKDGTEAFDLLTSTLQNVAPSVRDEVMQATEEYSTFFEDLGLTGEEAFSMIATAAEKGGNFGVDKVGDALKELTIRSTDMSKTSQEAYEKAGLSAEEMAGRFLEGGDTARGAMDELIEGLLSIEDPVEQSNAAIALFGTPLEDLSTAEIPEFLGQMGNIESSLGDVEGATKRAGDTLNSNLGKQLDALKREGMQGLIDIGRAVVEQMEKMWPYVVDAWDYIQDAIEKARPTLDNIQEKIAEFATEAMDFFAKMQTKVEEHWPPIRDLILQVVDKIQERIQKFVDLVERIWNEYGDEIMRVAKAAWDYIKRTIGNAIDIIAGIIKTVLAVISGDWDAAWDGIKQILSAAWDQIKNVLGTALEVVKSLLNAALDTLESLWDAAWSWVAAFLSNTWDDIKAKASSTLDSLVQFFTDLPGRIVETVKLGLEALKDLGRWVVRQILNGIIALAEASDGLVGWMKGLPQRLYDWVIEGAGKLVDLGEALVEKIKEGIRNIGSSIGSTIQGFIPDSVAGFDLPWKQGDGPGAPPAARRGGSALSRVQSALVPGTYVTSTYRSPAHNARVGGSPTSYHMDRDNPAVDIGGSTAALDRMARKLRAMGGWREFLWRTSGHYDHIHVAHKGGRVTKDGIEPLKQDELLTKLQVGETVIPKGTSGALHVEIIQNFHGFSTEEARRLAREGTEEALKVARQRKRTR